jgi:hypothetical protein
MARKENEEKRRKKNPKDELHEIKNNFTMFYHDEIC